MKKTLLTAVSATAFLFASGAALAQSDEEPAATSETMEESTTEDMGVTEEGSDTGGSSDAESMDSDTPPPAADDAETPDTGMDSDTGTDTDMDMEDSSMDEAPSTDTGTGTDTGTDTGADTDDAMESTAPVDLSQLHPHGGDAEGIVVEGVPAEDIVGGHLVNQDGERIATINDLLIDSDGEPQGLLVGFGGFLGFMEKEVAVGFDRVEFTQNEDEEYPSDLTEEEIEAMPEYEEPQG
ncbi:PRC-barrel domain-containing protein [Aquibaculum arenosum]|uniref:PRC-barrel domain-containing protein n=1 Tax=Aquibaculum arenosum TaxID=3032591 RepID=A0ABT5YRM0_9PROT|nr:PRC-barrel domain-containing protein [Fodinicurvata sp. CAU 1616]MDF2097421.1 PRC-barrel domain-containing protein [Fodinicurvata sp. CAU 1616]